MGYDEIILVGYDFCWNDDGKYYAFDKEANGKRNYMKHVFALSEDNQYVFTSNNLAFSGKWLQDYTNSGKVPVVQCSRPTIARCRFMGDLEKHMQYTYKPGDRVEIQALMRRASKLQNELGNVQKRMIQIGRDHYYNVLGNTA